MTSTLDTTIRPATLRDVPYIDSLRNKLSYELGFIPRIAISPAATDQMTTRWRGPAECLPCGSHIDPAGPAPWGS